MHVLVCVKLESVGIEEWGSEVVSEGVGGKGMGVKLLLYPNKH